MKAVRKCNQNGPDRRFLQQILCFRRNFRPTFELNLTEPIASNFYPVTDRLFIQDEAKANQLTILTDRAQAGSSLHEGQLEFMVIGQILPCFLT